MDTIRCTPTLLCLYKGYFNSVTGRFTGCKSTDLSVGQSVTGEDIKCRIKTERIPAAAI